MRSLDHLPAVLRAPRTDAIYNSHPYLTKVPVGAITPFIQALTAPGDVILDMFAGSGMTGVAAVSLGRHAHLSDISALGKHIGQGYLAKVDHGELREAAAGLVAHVRSRVGVYYQTQRQTDGVSVEMVRTVWSFTYQCPGCAFDLTYFEHLSASDGPPAACPKCAYGFSRRNWPRRADKPVEVVCRQEVTGRLQAQPITAWDIQQIEAASRDERQSAVPSLPIEEHREMFSRSGLRKAGICETRDFFSARNAVVLLELWRAIDRASPSQVQQKLRFCFTAMLARASRRYQWSRRTPLNAQNQTYYIAPVYYEWNVFELFERKVEAASRSDRIVFGRSALASESSELGEATYTIASASNLAHLTDASIDYVFTDPPFGSNIFYSDMNLFHEAWLGVQTDPSEEAVVHTTGQKKGSALQRYEQLLSAAFREAHRSLKTNGRMSVVFGNSDGQMWGVLQRALRQGGFNPVPIHVSVLDKGQRSVKGLASGVEKTATVDLVLTVVKAECGDTKRVTAPPSLTSLLDLVALPEEASTASHFYALILREAILKGLSVADIHLADVIEGLQERGFALNPATGALVPPRSSQGTRHGRRTTEPA